MVEKALQSEICCTFENIFKKSKSINSKTVQNMPAGCCRSFIMCIAMCCTFERFMEALWGKAPRSYIGSDDAHNLKEELWKTLGLMCTAHNTCFWEERLWSLRWQFATVVLSGISRASCACNSNFWNWSFLKHHCFCATPCMYLYLQLSLICVFPYFMNLILMKNYKSRACPSVIQQREPKHPRQCRAVQSSTKIWEAKRFVPVLFANVLKIQESPMPSPDILCKTYLLHKHSKLHKDLRN